MYGYLSGICVRSESVKSFYGRISGANFENSKDQLLKDANTWDRISRDYREKGDLYQALNGLPRDYRWTWRDSHDLVAEFIRDLIEGRQKYKELESR